MRRAIVVAILLTSLAPVIAIAAATNPPLATGITDPYTIQGTSNYAAFREIRKAGASFVRLSADWSGIAPASRASYFNPSDPTDTAYDWSVLDSQIEQAVAAGLKPIVDVVAAPVWASRPGGTAHDPIEPDPTELGAFASAIARRYSGTVAGLPRVRYWQLWNEPNVSVYLLPQFKGAQTVSPIIYRNMVNAFADGIHQAASSNIVIAGGLSPFTVNVRGVQTVGPLRFMRLMLCMSAGARPVPACSTKVHFDVWAHHPYTSGGPFHRALNPNDVSLGDLPKMKKLLDAARTAHHIVAPHGLGFWVTEFSWDTSPPDPNAVPIQLQARWTAEALYQMWRSGVTLATWFTLKDQPYPQSSFQSGLYFIGSGFGASLRKPTWTAFRFPFVAYSQPRGSTTIWGRTPTSLPGPVAIQAKAGAAWYTLATLRADAHGIFTGSLTAPLARSDDLRASAGTSSSLPFSLTQPPDHPYHAFG